MEICLGIQFRIILNIIQGIKTVATLRISSGASNAMAITFYHSGDLKLLNILPIRYLCVWKFITIFGREWKKKTLQSSWMPEALWSSHKKKMPGRDKMRFLFGFLAEDIHVRGRVCAFGLQNSYWHSTGWSTQMKIIQCNNYSNNDLALVRQDWNICLFLTIF